MAETFVARLSTKKPGWFSRRHQGNDIHAANSEANQARIAARYESAWARQAASNKLTTAQKLAKLPVLGESKRERAKLTARLAAEKASAPKPKAPKAPKPEKSSK